MRRILSLTTCAVVLAITGCASSNKAPAQPKVVKSITLIPVLAPEKLYTDNRGAPLVGALWTGIANTILDKSKSAEFEAKYADYRKTMGEKLTVAIMKELQAQGFKVQLANSADVVRSKDGELDYKKFSSHDTLLNTYYSEVAMYSGRVTAYYLPMVNTTIDLVKPLNQDSLFGTTYYYGAYATKNIGSYIESDKKFQFPNFPDLIDKPELVQEALEAGINKTAERIGSEIRKELTPAQ